MTLLAVCVTVTIATFALRIVGLTAPITQTTGFWKRFLHFIPLSIFTALTLSALYSAPDALSPKLIALVVAAMVAIRTRQFGLSVLVGMAALWLLLVVF